jgi:hypothetical protein
MDRDATIDALSRLSRAVIEHRRLYWDLISYLKIQFDFCSSNDTRKVKDAAFNYLISKKIVRVRSSLAPSCMSVQLFLKLTR